MKVSYEKEKIISNLWSLRWLVRAFFRIMKIFVRERFPIMKRQIEHLANFIEKEL